MTGYIFINANKFVYLCVCVCVCLGQADTHRYKINTQHSVFITELHARLNDEWKLNESPSQMQSKMGMEMDTDTGYGMRNSQDTGSTSTSISSIPFSPAPLVTVFKADILTLSPLNLYVQGAINAILKPSNIQIRNRVNFWRASKSLLMSWGALIFRNAKITKYTWQSID